MSYNGNVKKIDNEAVLGLLGTSNSLAYRVHEIERHFHGRERWFGISASQAGNDWALATSVTPFSATPGSTGTFGTEAKIWGTDDVSLVGGNTKFDLNELLIVSAGDSLTYKIRIIYGTGTVGDAETAGQYSETMFYSDPASSQTAHGITKIRMPRLDFGTHKVWIKTTSMNATTTAITFFCGLHEYEG